MSQPQRMARRFLPAGTVLRRVLRADPGQAYFLYIAESSGDDAPLLVSVHGASRNALEHAKLMVPYAEKYGVVLLAPHFDDQRFGDYQKLGTDRPGGRADAVLDDIVREVGWLTGASVAQIYLVGFSGGAQFAHRYTMAHPFQVAAAVLLSAGWYTFPDPGERYPYGLRPSNKHAVINFDPEAFLRVPMTVLTSQDEDEDDGSLRRTERVDQQQGVTRRERALRWVKAMRDAAEAYRIEPAVIVEEVPAGAHSFQELVARHGPRIFEVLLAGRRASFAPALGQGRGGE